MFRQFDFECPQCGHTQTDLTNVPHGESPKAHDLEIDCHQCGHQGMDRIVSLPAPYTGEMVLNVEVSGGKHDTLGHKKGPPVPEFRGESFGDFREHYRKNKDIYDARQQVRRENRQKRERYAALRRGENVNFRRDKVIESKETK